MIFKQKYVVKSKGKIYEGYPVDAEKVKVKYSHKPTRQHDVGKSHGFTHLIDKNYNVLMFCGTNFFEENSEKVK